MEDSGKRLLTSVGLGPGLESLIPLSAAPEVFPWRCPLQTLIRPNCVKFDELTDPSLGLKLEHLEENIFIRKQVFCGVYGPVRNLYVVERPF